MANNVGKTPDVWRNFSTKVPISAFRMKRGDLKRLYKIINEKQIDYRDRFISNVLQIQPSETLEQFEERKKRVCDHFVTSVTASGINGELVHGNNEAFLENENVPEQLRSILIMHGHCSKGRTEPRAGMQHNRVSGFLKLADT